MDGGEIQPGPGSSNDESTLDIEDVSALAPGADIDVYEAPNTTSGGIDEYAQIVNSDVDQIVTSSWGVCEQLAQVAEPGVQEAENLLFEQAAAQGQTILSAAGDTGDDECNEGPRRSAPSGQNVLSLLDPASQPYVLSVGGTTIDEPPSHLGARLGQRRAVGRRRRRHLGVVGDAEPGSCRWRTRPNNTEATSRRPRRWSTDPAHPPSRRVRRTLGLGDPTRRGRTSLRRPSVHGLSYSERL